MPDRQEDVRRKELKIIMGWNGSGQKGAAPAQSKATAKKPSPWRGLVAGLVIVLALGAYFIFFAGLEKPQKVATEKQPTKIKEVKPAAAHKQQTNTVAAVAKTNDAPVFTDGRTSEWSKKFSKDSKWNATTNSFGQQIEIVWDHGEMHKRISYSKPPMFDNASDQALAMATAAGDGPMPPIPIHPQAEKQFRESLKREIVINDDDPYEVKLRKADVINARAEMKKLLDAGESFESVINRTVEDHNANYSLRQEARSSVKNMLESDPEGATELMNRYNEVLRKNGIKELTAEDFEARKPGKKKEVQ